MVLAEATPFWGGPGVRSRFGESLKIRALQKNPSQLGGPGEAVVTRLFTGQRQFRGWGGIAGKDALSSPQEKGPASATGV